MPNISAIWKSLRDTDKAIEIDKKVLLGAISDFEALCDNADLSYIKGLKENVSVLDGKITVNDIRKVVSQTGDLEFEELLPLMAVGFVRNGQYTVLPFPFKYLREWKA